MRLDPLLVEEPGEHIGRPIAAVAGEPRRIKIEAVLCPIDHALGRSHLGLADGGGADFCGPAIRSLLLDQVVELPERSLQTPPISRPAAPTMFGSIVKWLAAVIISRKIRCITPARNDAPPAAR